MLLPLTEHAGWARRACSALAVAAALAAAPALAAQRPPDAVGQPMAPREALAQPEQLFREATRAFDKGSFRRAAELFELARERSPRMPYVSDSYYWQAFALQQLDDREARQRALGVLDALELRFPDAATRDDVSALRRRIEERLPPVRPPREGACTDRDETSAVAALQGLTTLTDPAAIAGRLAELLARRGPCDRELRRSVVYLLARRADTDAHARRTLAVVAERDPDPAVREEARAAATPPAERSAATASVTPAPRVQPPPDTEPHVVGDPAATGRVTVGAPHHGRLTVSLERPAHLVVLAVAPGAPPVLFAPATPEAARREVAGTITVDLRRAAGSPVLVAGALDAGQELRDFRRDAEVDACIARQTARVQADIDRQWNARTDKSGKPVVPGAVGGAIDFTAPGGGALLTATAACRSAPSRVPTAPLPAAGAAHREALRDDPIPGSVLVVLALTEPVSMPWLLVRLGTVPVTGATGPARVAPLTRALLAGHPGAWSGVVRPW